VLEKHPDLPAPTVPATGEAPALWAWPALRPWLEAIYGKRLPERFPGT